MTESDAALSTMIADPAQGPQVADVLMAELGRVLEAIGEQDVSGVPYSDSELARRVGALGTATDQLARLSATSGYWAPVETARLWPQVLAALLGSRERGTGLRFWLELVAYPALLVLYAFGLGASIGRRHEALALALTAPAPSTSDRWEPAIIQVNSASFHEDMATKMPGAKSRRWALSDHLFEASRPWFADIVPLDALFEREFDRFEILASLVYFDLQRGEDKRGWSPIGRFARHGRYDQQISQELIAEARRVATETNLLGSLVVADGDRVAATLAGFDHHVTRALAQVW